jgi:N-acetylneuraminic acid mutarotase
MKAVLRLHILAICLLDSLFMLSAAAQGTAFTYQGRLNSDGAPASGIYDLRFTIYDSSAAGNLIAGPLTNSSTGIANGLFTAALDFGANFTGADRWLEIAVRTNGSGPFASLSPRQQVTATPYAMTAGNVSGPVSAGQLFGSVPASQLSGTILLAQIPTALVTNGAVGVNFTGAFTGNGGALTNLAATNLAGTVADDRLSPNIARLSLLGTVTQATATAVIYSGFLVGANVVKTGSGYTFPPIVTVTDATGSGAMVTAQIVAGLVTGLTVSDAGSGYSSNAIITVASPLNNANQIFNSINLFTHPSNQFVGAFTGNGDSLSNLPTANLIGTIPDARFGANIARLNTPAAAVQALATPVVFSGFIIGAIIIQGGSGYLAPPAVTVNDPTGSGAVITAQITGGVLTSLTVTDAGFGYSAGAAITIAPPPNNVIQTFSSINLFNNPSNQFTGAFAGNGGALTNLNGANLVAGSVTAAKIASNSITSGQLASGAAAANLGASGQGIVPSGGVILSANYSDSNLTTQGYVKLANVNLGDVWEQRTNGSPPNGRFFRQAVWTGSEMIVWGGSPDGGISGLNNGGRYNPTANTWTVVSASGSPAARYEHSAVWTGSEMVVWGGSPDSFSYLNDGGRYNPVANTWTNLTTIGAPVARRGHKAVWTGTEMIVWGGNNSSSLNSGGRYNPTLNAWTAVSTSGAPTARSFHTAVWTGSEMIVWGGNAGVNFNDGGRYNPAGNGWTALTTTGAPAGRYYHTAVWTGNEMIVWGGQDGGSSYFNDGGRYNPSGNIWTAATTNGAPVGRYNHTAVWTGSEMIVWGGSSSVNFNDGGRYNPVFNTWTAVSTAGAPAARQASSVVWTGSEMIVWGGYNGSYLNDTFSYTPSRVMYLYQRP